MDVRCVMCVICGDLWHIVISSHGGFALDKYHREQDCTASCAMK